MIPAEEELVRRRVLRKQHNSSMCLVCGLQNPAGLHASFFELEGGELLALYTPRADHQGYPGRLHGGIAAALLDETIGRAINAREQKEAWAVSVELTTRFRRPVPLDGEIRVLAEVTKRGRRLFEGKGKILLSDGTIAVEGRGKYLKMSLEKIADVGTENQWAIVPSPDDPEEVEL